MLVCYKVSHCNPLSSQKVPLALSVFPLQFAKLAVLANPVIYVVMNKAVRSYIFYIFYMTFIFLRKSLD